MHFLIRTSFLSLPCAQVREAARRCHKQVEQLQDCQVTARQQQGHPVQSGKELMGQELGLREEAIHRCRGKEDRFGGGEQVERELEEEQQKEKQENWKMCLKRLKEEITIETII